MAEMHEDDYEWQPPTEAELKIIQARRERSDKISKLMGDYLLKGYKMLGNTCEQCNTILLQDKQGVNFCIACKELDTDTDKDDPVLNLAAARSQILEGSRTDPEDTDDMSYLGRREQPQTVQTTPQASQIPVSHNLQTTPQATLTPVSHNLQTSTSSSGVSSLPGGSASVNVNLVDSIETLCQKIQWATDELKRANSVDYSVNLCQLIKSAADAIHSVKLAS